MPERPSSPARRRFLVAGGLSTVAAGLAACSDGDGNDGEGAGGSTTTSGVPGRVEGGANAGDIDLTIAAAQVEHTLVTTYDAILAEREDDLAGIGLAEVAALLRDHHVEHAEALNDLLGEHGGPVVAADELFAGVVLLSADDVTSLPIADLTGFARSLENQAAQTYVTTVPRLSLPELRRSLLAIGAAEARHVAMVDIILGGGVAGYTATAELIVAGNYPVNESLLNS